MGTFFGQRSGGLTNTGYFGGGRKDEKPVPNPNPRPLPEPPAPNPNVDPTTQDNTNQVSCDEMYRQCQKNCEGGRGAGGPRTENCLSRCEARYERCKARKETPGPGPTNAGCPEGVGPGTTEGCPCGDEYGTTSGKCAAGYAFVAREPWTKPINGIPYKEGMIGTCECRNARRAWQQEHGQAGLGEYQWPPELMDLYGQLIGRAGGLLNREPGIPDDVLNLMFGKNFENVRGQEAGTREQILNNLSSQGMLGTGAGMEALNKNAWNTEGNVGNIKRDLAIYESQKELEDLLSQTDMANKLFGTGAGFNQALEAMNAGRRGEGMQWMNMMMAWLAQLLGSWAA